MSTNEELYLFVLALEKDGKASSNTDTFNERISKLNSYVTLLIEEMKIDTSF